MNDELRFCLLASLGEVVDLAVLLIVVFIFIFLLLIIRNMTPTELACTDYVTCGVTLTFTVRHRDINISSFLERNGHLLRYQF